MSSQLDSAELLDSCDPASPEAGGFPGLEIDGDIHRLAPARGIVVGVIIAVPIWALLGFTIYLLI